MFKKIFSLFTIISILLISSCGSLSKTIVMPHDSAYYTNEFEGTVANLYSEFEEMGFENIETYVNRYTLNRNDDITKVLINGISFDKNDKYKPDDSVSIYCNEYSSFLNQILTDKNADYIEFLDEFDGEVIEFDGCVQTSYSYMAGTEHIIEVSGGNYSSSGYEGLLIRVNVDNLTSSKYSNDIDKDIEKGTNVKVVGIVNQYRGEYFNLVYIEAIYLKNR